MFLPCSTETDRSNLILISETIEKYGYDPSSLGRHSGQMVVFKCIVCALPFDNTKKKVLDKKGLTHPGDCRLAVRKDAGQRSRQLEDPKHKEVRKEKLRERIAKDKDQIVSRRQKTLIDKYGSKNLSEIDSIRQNISKGVSLAYSERNEEIIKKRQAANLEKYGSTNFLTSEKGLQNLIQKNQAKHGVDYPFQNKEFQTKAREEYIATSGFKNPSHDPQVNRKRKETNIQRYGSLTPLENKDIQDKKEKTSLAKYGFAQPSKSDEVRRKIGISLSTGELIADIYREYSVPPCSAQKILREYGEQAFWDFCKNYSGPPISSLEQRFIRIMEPELSLTHYNKNPEFSSSSKPDFKCRESFYVNVDGLYWHSEVCISNAYHLDLARTYQAHEVRLMQFREDEIRDNPLIVKSIVLNSLGLQKTKLHARKCNLKEVPYVTSKNFFHDNHLMGHISATTFGLYYNEELVCAISVKRTDDDSIEIARFGSKNFCNVRGGFSKLLNHVIKIYNPRMIVSFCDLRYADGHSYESLGFKRVSVSQGWQWTDFQSTFNRRKCRANMDERKLSEREYAEEKGWVKIYDAGQAKYVKHLERSSK